MAAQGSVPSSEKREGHRMPWLCLLLPPLELYFGEGYPTQLTLQLEINLDSGVQVRKPICSLIEDTFSTTSSTDSKDKNLISVCFSPQLFRSYLYVYIGTSHSPTGLVMGRCEQGWNLPANANPRMQKTCFLPLLLN